MGAGSTRCLTLPSSGHATACHAWPSFHSGPCASCRCVPLMSNVRAQQMQSRPSLKHRAQFQAPAFACCRALRSTCICGFFVGCSLAVLAPSSISCVRTGSAARREIPQRVSRSPYIGRPHKGASRQRAAPCSQFVAPLRGSAGLGSTIASHQSQGAVLGVVANSKVIFHVRQRPNPSVKRTHNGGSRLFALQRSAAPLRSAYLKR